MKIVMVPSGFKECLDAEEVALAMEKGAKRFDTSVNRGVIFHTLYFCPSGQEWSCEIVE
jgi:hypothetical protein